MVGVLYCLTLVDARILNGVEVSYEIYARTTIGFIRQSRENSLMCIDATGPCAEHIVARIQHLLYHSYDPLFLDLPISSHHHRICAQRNLYGPTFAPALRHLQQKPETSCTSKKN